MRFSIRDLLWATIVLVMGLPIHAETEPATRAAPDTVWVQSAESPPPKELQGARFRPKELKLRFEIADWDAMNGLYDDEIVSARLWGFVADGKPIDVVVKDTTSLATIKDALRPAFVSRPAFSDIGESTMWVGAG